MYLKTPPLLIASSFAVIRIRTNFPSIESVQHEIRIAELAKPEKLDVIKKVFDDPDWFNTGKTRDDVTKETATLFQAMSTDMAGSGYGHHDLAKYLNQIIFCLYAEDAGLLPDRSFTDLVVNQRRDPLRFQRGAETLFSEMNCGGLFGPETIDQFNGELFAHIPGVTLNTPALERLAEATEKNWSNIEPSIFGTLFERALGLTEEQAPLGAHYTSEVDIRRVVEPVILDHLERRWGEAKSDADTCLHGGHSNDASQVMQVYREHLGGLQVLDPACGSGNFLYVTLKALLDLERRAIDYQIGLGTRPVPPMVSPTQMLGLEVNEYATQLAKTALWIGYIQWHQANGFEYTNRPILDNINGIECRDATISDACGAAVKSLWPSANYIVGNPPFLGTSNMLAALGDRYTHRLRETYATELNGAVDLCCYWFEQARAQIAAGRTERAGLLATQTIRSSTNRQTLERIKKTGDIFAAHDDLVWKPKEPKSAAVHVSIICFDDGSEKSKTLNGTPASDIDASLMDGLYLYRSQSLPQNADVVFQGTKKGGAFDISPAVAARMLAGSNPNRKPNRDVITPYVTGDDLNGIPEEGWLIDFGNMEETDAQKYNQPYQHCLAYVKPDREKSREPRLRDRWWQHDRGRIKSRAALKRLGRYIGTSQVSKHRYFQYINSDVAPDGTLIVFCRDDDYFLGILESRIHKVWTAAVGTQLREKESAQRYIIGDCFGKFPFPSPTQSQRDAIAVAAHELDTQRQNTCRPNGRVKLSMNDLYDCDPPWLQTAHAKLDQAVANAYNWRVHLTDNDILQKLVRLNLSGQAGAP